ncbi:MAG: metallophosphoesterase family protein [Chloroflexi bacterium]|nr:metallophosphoesterase family protein [Chloroflexota bacterium]
MRYAIISDVHANRTALRAVEEAVRQLRRELMNEEITYWFLGDLVGYGPAEEALECIRWLRRESGIPFDPDTNLGERWVPGNHDGWLVSPGEQLRPDAVATLRRQIDLLQQPGHEEDREWFFRIVRAALHRQPAVDQPDVLGEETRSLVIEPHAVLTMAFVHASVFPATRRITYLYPWRQTLLAEDLRQLRMQSPAPILCLFHGHTHFPVFARLGEDGQTVVFQPIKYGQPIRLNEGCYAINPGSVGQPRDGDTRAAFVILDTEAGTVEFRRVEYDVHEVVHKLNRESQQAPHEHRQVYQPLVDRLRTANGGEELHSYRGIYRSPEWDLEVVKPA